MLTRFYIFFWASNIWMVFCDISQPMIIATIAKQSSINQNYSKWVELGSVVTYWLIPVVFFIIIYKKYRHSLAFQHFFSISLFNIVLFIGVLICLSYQKTNDGGYIYEILHYISTTGVIFIEQLLFFSGIILFPKSILRFILSSFVVWAIFSFGHKNEFNWLQIIAYLVVFCGWIFTSSQRNIWSGVLVHLLWNKIDIPYEYFNLIYYVMFPNLALYMAFGTRQYTPQSLAIFRVLFPFKLGRAVLAVLLWIFQTPQDLWRKYVRREVGFEYGARVIMTALGNDIRENPFWGKTVEKEQLI